MGFDHLFVPTDPPPVAAAPAAMWCSTARVVLGMPALDACGLSESWLQKTCGERHWCGLAALLGRPPQAWADLQGRRVYAAFGLLRLSDADLAAAGEGRVLLIGSELARVGRTQAWSRHRLRCGGRNVGQLEMLSVFISRTEGDCNRSVRRADLGLEVGSPPAGALAMVEHARLRRKAMAASLPAEEAPAWVCQPCPRSDFNGAGLLYFPSFSALADRALWAGGRLGRHSRVRSRECCYLGNIAVGEAVRVTLVSADGPRLTVHIASDGDGRPLALLTLTVEHGS